MNFGGKRKVLNFEKKMDKPRALVSDAAIAWEELEPGIKRKIMTYNERLMMVKVAFKKDAIGTLHHHPHLQMSYVSKGKFEVTIDKEVKTLESGDAFFVPENKTHGVVCLEDGELIDIFNPAREDFL